MKGAERHVVWRRTCVVLASCVGLGQVGLGYVMSVGLGYVGLGWVMLGHFGLGYVGLRWIRSVWVGLC
jgi:hypothetical protein